MHKSTETHMQTNVTSCTMIRANLEPSELIHINFPYVVPLFHYLNKNQTSIIIFEYELPASACGGKLQWATAEVESGKPDLFLLALPQVHRTANSM